MQEKLTFLIFAGAIAYSCARFLLIELENNKEGVETSPNVTDPENIGLLS